MAVSSGIISRILVYICSKSERKNSTNNCIVLKIVLYLHYLSMAIINLCLSEREADLIEAIRNYVKSYPNGYPELLDYAQRLFDELTYPFDD